MRISAFTRLLSTFLCTAAVANCQWAHSENDTFHPHFSHSLSKRQAPAIPAACQLPVVNCAGASTSRYRSYDGTCNNLNNPLMGSRNRQYGRILPAAYEDGISVPRGGLNSRLPNPREISVGVHIDSTPISNRATIMVPQFGQFLDHDITSTPNGGRQCCSNPSIDANCWSIPIPATDVFYSSRSVPQTCLDFTRSTTCSSPGAVREQVNEITAFIDGSQVYGSDADRVRRLRSFQGGKLVTNPNYSGFLPSGTQVGVNVTGTFAAGDDRINAMPGLAVLHNVFLMEHNRIAQEFQRITGNTNDEYLFQETRRLIIALLQNIVYNEYLPVLFSPSVMTQYNLNLPSGGYSTYSPTTDPSIFNSFAAAAYRFGHSMVTGLVKLVGTNNAQSGSYFIRDQYFQSGQITTPNDGQGSGYDKILRSLMTQSAPEMDRHCTDGLTNFLFKRQTADFGGDLISRNIQRGRDHGLPSYNAFRQLAGLTPLSQSWDDRPQEISEDGWTASSQVYESYGNTPLDIDLFTGGLLETPADGGVTGPTFQYLKAVQFQRIKDGDRYFFTHNTGPHAFTATQVAILRNQRLSDVICRNSLQPDVPVNSFLVVSATNPMISCRNSNPMNIRHFV